MPSLIFIVILSLTISACSMTRFVRATDARSSLTHMNTKMQRDTDKIEQDFLQKQQLLATLIKAGAPAEKSPYKELQSDLEKMHIQVTALKQIESDLLLQTSILHKELKGHDQIDSENPLFQKISKFNEKSVQRTADINHALESYQQAMLKYNKRVKQHEIGELDIQRFLKQTEPQLTALNSKTKQHLRQLHHLKKDKPSAEKTQRIKKLEGLLLSLQQQLETIAQQTQQLAVQVGVKRSIIIGPSLPAHHLFLELKNTTKLAKAMQNQLHQTLLNGD